ncbi:hypothetical protein [Hyphomicrobium sp.]|jgi:hypothetical protein|uniref:hypothetical protein n=1 Tax=Hyphomicrobium sp. TaxID=82 RepID=UPI0035624220
MSLHNVDFSSWHSLVLTLIGLAVITLVGVGIRLLMMMTFQQRRERMNRQINERLRTLIGAYRTLGGSFTGKLSVDPSHLRDLRRGGDVDAETDSAIGLAADVSDRARRIRDAVEAALSDIILLGTEEQVKLATLAARELLAGNQVHTHELVVSLRNFVREALDLAPLPPNLDIPAQGPSRPPRSGGGGKGDRGKEETQKGAGDKIGGAGLGGGTALGGGMGFGLGGDDEPSPGGGHR